MLKLKEIRKAYPHNRGIVQVSLTINAEQLYLFVGENGSGKSTTIKLISRVIFHKREEGNLQNTFKRIIYLPDKRSYPKLLKVKTYLEYYLGKNNSIETWLERYNLPNKTIGSLSKGMLQKLGILQTILNDGDLYLLDEPTDGLDVHSIRLFKEDIYKLLEKKKTIIISTHNKTLYKDLKPRIYTFKEGIAYEKNKSLYTLFRLYLSYHLNKTFLIIFALLLVLWCFVLILNTGYPLEEEIYSIEATSYHFNYKEQSIFFLQIIDSVLISLLIGNEIHSLALFDSMFVPNTSRIRLIIVKILVNLFILALLLIWQIFFLELIGLLIFPKFIVTIESFKLILYVLLPMIELLLLGEFISLVFNSYFISILIFILGIVMNILLKVEAISKTLYYFIPKIIVQTKEIIIIGNIPIYLGICFLLVLASILMFQKKDISY